MKEIKLSDGIRKKNNFRLIALVDDEDYEFLSQWKWFAQTSNGRLFYATRNITKKSTDKIRVMHKVILKRHGLLDESKFTDHRDHDGLNCQKYNLRQCTRAENNKNRISAKNSSSKYLGVSLKVSHKKYNTSNGIKISTSKIWVATMTIDNKHRYLASFPFTEEGEKQAAKKYNEMATKHHGEFANLNQI